jgi:hypothetical protein
MFPSEGAGYRTRGFTIGWPETGGNTGEAQSQKARFAQYELMRACHKRRFAYTRRGWMGLVPEATQVGDLVAVLLVDRCCMYFVIAVPKEAVFGLLAKVIFME